MSRQRVFPPGILATLFSVGCNGRKSTHEDPIAPIAFRIFREDFFPLNEKTLRAGRVPIGLSFQPHGPLRAGFGTLRSRLPSGQRASSLALLFMTTKNHTPTLEILSIPFSQCSQGRLGSQSKLLLPPMGKGTRVPSLLWQRSGGYGMPYRYPGKALRHPCVYLAPAAKSCPGIYRPWIGNSRKMAVEIHQFSGLGRSGYWRKGQVRSTLPS